MKNTFLKFSCQFDDFFACQWSQGGMKLYLQLMLFPTMINKVGSLDVLKSYIVLKNGMFLSKFTLYCP